MMTRQIRVSGRVQGVGYRDALRAHAQRVGVTGWVRNRIDGTVEALLQGSPEAVEALIAWAGRGPAMAEVSAVAVEAPSAEADDAYTRFEVRPTS